MCLDGSPALRLGRCASRVPQSKSNSSEATTTADNGLIVDVIRTPASRFGVQRHVTSIPKREPKKTKEGNVSFGEKIVKSSPSSCHRPDSQISFQSLCPPSRRGILRASDSEGDDDPEPAR